MPSRPLTAQNTLGVTDILEATPEFLTEELDAVFTDIFPDAVKIGMVSSAPLIEVIAERLSRYQARHIVVDPVMVATSGSRLLRDDAVGALETKLLPIAEVVTPNIPEAEILSGMEIRSPEDMEKGRAGHIRALSDAPCSARVVTTSTTPTTCCGRTAKSTGSEASA